LGLDKALVVLLLFHREKIFWEKEKKESSIASRTGGMGWGSGSLDVRFGEWGCRSAKRKMGKKKKTGGKTIQTTPGGLPTVSVPLEP